MKNKRKILAVSEIVGVAILLGMSIAMYSVVQFMVFSYPFQPSTPSVNLVGSVNETTKKITIGHFGGEAISTNAKIILRINEVEESFKVSDDDSKLNFAQNPPPARDDLWEIGEIFTYSSTKDLEFAVIHVTIIDDKTNSVVMMGYIQGGSP